MADNKNWSDGSTTAFDATRFEEQEGVNADRWYVDGSDAYANHKQMLVSFLHVPSNSVVSFKAFITTFNDTYNSDWAAETVYGRADPIYMFKNTTRKISLAFVIPAASEGEAFENLGRVQKLVQFLYPNYTTLTNAATGKPDAFAQTISQSPLVRLKMFNILNNHGDTGINWGPLALKAKDVVKRPGMSFHTSPSVGLLGVIDNVTVLHNLEGEQGAFTAVKGVALPKLLEVNLNFSPIHEHTVGWVSDPANTGSAPTFASPHFPYSVDVEGSLPQPDASNGAGCSDATAMSEEDENAILEGEDPIPVDEDGVPGSTACAAEAAAEASEVLGTDAQGNPTNYAWDLAPEQR